jgi:hypothetical protein
MRTTPTFIHRQTLLVLDSSSEIHGTYATPSGTSNAVTTGQDTVSVPIVARDISTSESRVVRTSFSSMPVVWQPELIQEYRELGEALQEMTELQKTDEWRIEPPVLGAALNVAAGLMVNSYPAPRVFTHGPKSVVFNWSAGTNDLYLTISADRVSALISTPERITQRVDFLANEFLKPGDFLSTIQSAHLEPQVRLLTGSVPDPFELVD